MKVAIKDIYREEKIYSRQQINRKRVASYKEALEIEATFPPILLQRIRYGDEERIVYLDGVHRAEAHREAGLKKIAAEFYQDEVLDYKSNWIALRLVSAKANSKHGLRGSDSDNKATARLIANNDPEKEWSQEALAEPMGVKRQTVSNWIKDIRARQRASRNNIVYRLSHLGWTQEEIAKVDGRKQERISQIINNANFGEIHNSLKSGKSIEDIAEYEGLDLTLTQALALEGEEDEARFEKLDIAKKKFTVWNYTEANNLMGDEGFNGRIPGQIAFNAIHYFSNQRDLVVDPMAGSGTTQDACLLLNRKNRSYDIKPHRKTIEQNDINDGLPIDSADFVFVNPPYWNMIDYGYGSDQSLSDFYNTTMTNLIKESSRILKSDKYFALIIANQSARKWLDKSEETKNMHRIDHVLRTIDIAKDNDFKLWWRIYAPQPTQGANRWAEREWKNNRLADITRELLIFRRI